MALKIITLSLTACLVLAMSTGCSKKKSEEEISADEIMKGMEPAKSAANAQPGKEKFSEPEELAAQKKNRLEVKAVDKTGGLKSASTPAGNLAGLSEDGAYVVQVCVFVSPAAAKRLAAKLSADGYPAYVAEVQNPKPELPGVCYRVRVGNFRSLRAARDAGEKIASDYDLAYWADMKSNDNVAKTPSSYDSYTPAAAPAETYSPPPSTETPAASSSDWGSPSTPAPAPEPAPAPPPPAAEPPATPSEPPSAAPATGAKKPGDNFDF